MSTLRARLEDLEALQPAPTRHGAYVLIRVADGTKDGQGVLPDRRITGVAHGIGDGATLTIRKPGEAVDPLCRRAALALAPKLHQGAVAVIRAVYVSPDPT